MKRRDFLAGVTGAASGIVLSRAHAFGGAYSAIVDRLSGAATASAPLPLRIPTNASASALTLTAGIGRADIGRGTGRARTFNDELPGPTIRARRGEKAGITLRNELREGSIVHWHGLVVPEKFDGHPRLAIPPGSTYEYAFPIDQRAGTYWYHPHAHHRTAPQVYMGLAGLFLVSDEEEDALELPSGDYELPVVLRDARLDGGELTYAPSMQDTMMGHLGAVPVANGTTRASVRVDRARYRLRMLNASNARIFKLALSTGASLTLVGNDGGLLDAPQAVSSVLLAPGERIDVLVDFRRSRSGERAVLRSLPFTLPGMAMGQGMRGMGRGMGAGMLGVAQGTPMDLLEFNVAGPRVDAPPVPPRLSAVPLPNPTARPEHRTFRFDSTMMRHSINGRAFDLERVDARVPLGRTERWSFVNDSEVPHPVHLHATHFQIVQRAGSRTTIEPWERGIKDTVLLLPSERVDVLVRFDRHRGLFLLHCHNLEHEDAGMMANVEVG